jgi:hypothetical protein
MRKKVFRAFDRYLDNNGTTAFGRLEAVFADLFHIDQGGKFSSSQLDNLLGAHDEFGLFAVVDDVSSTTAVSFDLFVDHSGDGINWLPLNQANQTPPFHFGLGDIHLSVTNTSPAAGWFVTSRRGVSIAGSSPSASGPMLHYVRLYMVMSAGVAHVRVHAFGRGK